MQHQIKGVVISKAPKQTHESFICPPAKSIYEVVTKPIYWFNILSKNSIFWKFLLKISQVIRAENTLFQFQQFLNILCHIFHSNTSIQDDIIITLFIKKVFLPLTGCTTFKRHYYVCSK